MSTDVDGYLAGLPIALHPLPQRMADVQPEAAVAPHRGAEDAMHLRHRDPLPLDLTVRGVRVPADR